MPAARTHAPGHLLSACLPGRLWKTPRASPVPPHSPPVPSLSSALSPARTRTRQRAPPCTAAATATPSLPLRPRRLRLAVFVLSTESRGARSSAAPPPPPFPRRPPKIIVVDSPPRAPPRAHGAALRPPSELLHRLPLSPWPVAHRSISLRHARELHAAGEVVTVARASSACP